MKYHCDFIIHAYLEHHIEPQVILYDILFQYAYFGHVNTKVKKNYQSYIKKYIGNYFNFKYQPLLNVENDRLFSLKLLKLFDCPSNESLDRIQKSSALSKFFIKKWTKKSNEDYIIRVIRHLKIYQNNFSENLFTELLSSFFSVFSHYRIHFNGSLERFISLIPIYPLTKNVESLMERIKMPPKTYTRYSLYINERDLKMLPILPSYSLYYKKEISALLLQLIGKNYNAFQLKLIDYKFLITNEDKSKYLESIKSRLYYFDTYFIEILNTTPDWITKPYFDEIKSTLFQLADSGGTLSSFFILNKKFDWLDINEKKKLISLYPNINMYYYFNKIPSYEVKLALNNLKSLKHEIDIHHIKDQFLNKINTIEDEKKFKVNDIINQRCFSYLAIVELKEYLTPKELTHVKTLLLNHHFKTSNQIETLFILNALTYFAQNLNDDELKKLSNIHNDLMSFISIKIEYIIDEFFESTLNIMKKLNILIDKPFLDAFISMSNSTTNLHKNDTSDENKFIEWHLSFIKLAIKNKLINDDDIKHFTLQIFKTFEHILKINFFNWENRKISLMTYLIEFISFLPLKEKSLLSNFIISSFHVYNHRSITIRAIANIYQSLPNNMQFLKQNEYYKISEGIINYYSSHQFSSVILTKEIETFKYFYTPLSLNEKLKILLTLQQNNQKITEGNIQPTLPIHRYEQSVNLEALLDYAYHLYQTDANIKLVYRHYQKNKETLSILNNEVISKSFSY